MRQQAGRSQRSKTHSKWATSLLVGTVVSFVALPAHAQNLMGFGASPWVSTTIVSVASVIALWLASLGLSTISLKMRWVSPHRHNRLTRGLQVVFGGLLLAAVIMPYLAMHHPLLAVGLLLTGVLMTCVVGAKNRQLQGDSN